MRECAEWENAYSAPFLPGYNNNTTLGIVMLDFSQEYVGSRAVEMYWSWTNEVSDSNPGGR